ncbi:FtsK/SpoIIIE domain-containing protein [Kitasatospora cinereorecta]|uniref:FtsK/SpoIIIE domain-containing protein n=1 Tax=Kitasatospora cinereorecta TaxID=285560 RepID=UPI0031F9062F
MQIRLTVLRPRSGPSGAGASTDVLVTAPAGTALGSVAHALAGAVGVRGPRSATHVHLYAGARRLDESTPLGRPPLLDGAVLCLNEPDPDATEDDGPQPHAAELRVVGGPDAGGVHHLHGEEIRVGRSSEADVPLDDPDVSRLHLALHLAADGRVTVRDLGSTNGTVLDEPRGAGADQRFLRDESAELADGGLVRIGESTLQVHRPKAAATPSPAREAAPDGEGHLRIAPQPAARAHLAQPVPAPEPEPAQPAGRSRSLLSLRRAKAPESPRPDAAQQHAAARTRQAAAQRERWPDPAALLLTALSAGPRLWERGPAHPDALTLRLGTADRPGGAGTAPGTLLPAVPVTVDLQTAGSLGLAGPRHRVAGLARAVVAQLAALHPPSGLSVVVVAAEPETAAEWTWAQWLPHLRPAHGQACRQLFGFGPEQAEARLAELATASAGAPATVLVVDGDPGGQAARDALAVLLRQGPAVGVFTVCLDDLPERLPAGLGARALVTGEVGTLLTVERPAAGAREQVEEVALDAVSPAWAERLARVLAPLREAAPAARGPLPEALRLLDLLRLESVSPAKLAASWSALPPGAGSATALLGTSREDDTCALDLADPDLVEPGESGGPHLLIGGAAGSGKTELLRTLVASLAVSERPGRLDITVVEGRRAGEDGGLGGCTDLPHVGEHLNADDDPRRAMLLAQSLLDELDLREHRFEGRGFTEWHAARAADRAPALVAPGGAAVARASGARVVEPRRAPDAGPTPTPTSTPAGDEPVRAVVVVDDYDALLSPTSAAGRPLARALAEVARRGGRLGLHLIAATGAPEATAGTELDEAALLRIALRTDQPAESDLLIHLPDAATLSDTTPGRGFLRRPDGGVTAFQAARVSGRIPRTATLRPTVVALHTADLGAPPARRPVRELGNGPTDLALLASALQRAAEQ